VLLLSLALALPASTQTPTHSVLQNGGFEVDTSGWGAWNGTLTRTTTPVNSGSGAAQVTLDGIGVGNATQCIDLSPYLATWPPDGSTKYLTFSGYLHSDGMTEVNLSYDFWGNTDCTGTDYGFDVTSHITAASWQLHTITAAIPAGAQSVRVFFVGLNSMGSGTFYADDLAVYSSTVTAVQTRGMAARSGLWAAGLVGVAAVGIGLGRRKNAA